MGQSLMYESAYASIRYEELLAEATNLHRMRLLREARPSRLTFLAGWLQVAAARLGKTVRDRRRAELLVQSLPMKAVNG
jgi:hypothetical protein